MLSPVTARSLKQVLKHPEWGFRHFLDLLFTLSSPWPSRDVADSLIFCLLQLALLHLEELVHHREVWVFAEVTKQLQRQLLQLFQL